ncbi:tyrosine-type recombinase/integrase [Clostridium botulinum C]|uniref:Integrase n=2 Tax=Clostridium botulinum TaxID=1491 RepID=A0A9Q4TJB1_CLOBO|nr:MULTISPECIES: tyrosine-type recombinase/integrase [Clostridium]NFF71334.1 integrase [Clostridium botulinum]KEI08143.1 integrase [Clostridium novyi B str. NCTC 9691]MCD3195722.1 tyrosine-type recombinase/integrase [Clostridium botulinum C]MCD3201138.1 tyrosine-type recombinase/integrase [Clostridium botulinum C]MCD3206610.1 tyrosine-type recombinase/integrase [Clostridium botulinum C]
MNDYGIEKEEISGYIKIINKIPFEYKEEIQDYILNKIFQNKRFKTIESYCCDLIEFIKYLEKREKNIHDLKDKDLEQYKRYLLKHNLKPKSINRKLTSINQFLKFNNKQVKFTKIKEQQQNFLDNVLTKQEIDELIRCCGNNIRDKVIIMTLYKTGLRVSELITLTIKDVKKKIVKIVGKGGKHRDVIIPPDLNEAWNEYLKVRKKCESNKLFIGKRGPLKRGSINKIIIKYAKKAKISKAKAHPHNLRHAYCKYLADKGTPIQDIADLVGHKSIDTTRIYTRKTQEELLAIIEDM